MNCPAIFKSPHNPITRLSSLHFPLWVLVNRLKSEWDVMPPSPALITGQSLVKDAA